MIEGDLCMPQLISENTRILENARKGNMDAFNRLFQKHQPRLRSYIYRMVAQKSDCEDAVHDVFIKAFENIQNFRGEASFKTWIFTIATNHVRGILKNRSRWHKDTVFRIRELAHKNPELMRALDTTNRSSPFGKYEIREHIDFCFTCVSKMLKLEEQIATLLKHIYKFKIREIAGIMEFTESRVKHALTDGKRHMMDVFDQTCALISKKGLCSQCSELNGKFNPKQETRRKLMEIKMAELGRSGEGTHLFKLRTIMCSSVDPLEGEGRDLHEEFFHLCHMVNP